ncbi:MAG TPA: chromate efflux transporter [Spirochaetia bacterium]|nr:chromate efflux transporter [Spirochaetia bacterium]
MEQPLPAGNNRITGLLHLAAAFLHLGLSSFSLAVFNEARRQFVERRQWLTLEEYLEGVALAQLLPGAPALNLVSYLGHRLRGLAGSLTAAVCFLLPGFTTMVLLTELNLAYGTLPVVRSVLLGMGALVAGLLADTILNLWTDGADTPALILLAGFGFTGAFWSGSNIFWSLGAAVALSGLLTILSRLKPAWGRHLDRSLRPGRTTRPRDVPLAGSFTWRTFGLNFVWVLLLVGADLWITTRLPLYRQLGLSLFRTGALTFGSGYAMLPFIRETVVAHYHWLSGPEFNTALALSLMTPGPVTIIAAFIGVKTAGLAGAAAACINTYLPAFALVNLLAGFYRYIQRLDWLRSIIRGMVAVFIGSLGSILIGIAGASLHGPATWTLALAAFLARRFTRWDTVWIILAGAAMSALWFGLTPPWI